MEIKETKEVNEIMRSVWDSWIEYYGLTDLISPILILETESNALKLYDPTKIIILTYSHE